MTAARKSTTHCGSVRVQHILDANAYSTAAWISPIAFWAGSPRTGRDLRRVAALTSPWAFPYWRALYAVLLRSGSGHTGHQEWNLPHLSVFPPFFSFFPAAHGWSARPTGGVTGTGALCTSRGVTQYLRLTGTMYNGWSSTEGSLLSISLFDPKDHQT